MIATTKANAKRQLALAKHRLEQAREEYARATWARRAADERLKLAIEAYLKLEASHGQ